MAISWYHPPTRCAVTNIVPGDSQEVNCPEGAREATLGCGPNGPRNDTVVVTRGRIVMRPYNSYLTFA